MIPFIDLKTQYLNIKSQIDEAVLSTLASTQYSLGSEVWAFEEEFAEFCDVPHAIAVNSGTSALHLALLSAGIAPGDEVITVPNTFIATVAAIDYVGARPVFVDVDPVTLNMDVEKIEAKITERTRAILPVHLHGQPADMNPILKLSEVYGLKVIEDAAQAHDAEYAGKRAGSIGDIGCFSFYPGKNLGAYGEGGMVVTRNSDYAEHVRVLRDWGQTRKYHHDFKGFNYRMDGIQGAVLRVKLQYLREWSDSRRAHAAMYDEVLSTAGVTTPVEMPGTRHVYHVYAIRSSIRDTLQQKLTENEIQTGIHYPIPVHLQNAYSELGYLEGDFPESERAAKTLLSLPMFAELREDQIRAVCSVIEEVCYERE